MDPGLNPAQRLHARGQSLWLDSIDRVMLPLRSRGTGHRSAADAGFDADALAEHLERHGAGAFTADWAALLTAIKERAAKLTHTPEAKRMKGHLN